MTYPDSSDNRLRHSNGRGGGSTQVTPSTGHVPRAPCLMDPEEIHLVNVELHLSATINNSPTMDILQLAILRTDFACWVYHFSRV